MTQTCTICRHKKRAEIEQQIILKVPYRNIGKRYRLSYSSICKHLLKGHMTQAERAGLKGQAEKEKESQRMLKEVYDFALKASNCAMRSESYSGVGSILAQAARMAELRAKIEGSAGVSPTSIYDYLRKNRTNDNDNGTDKDKEDPE